MSEFEKVDKNEEKKQSTPEAGTVRRELSDVNGPQGGMLPDSVSQKIQSKRGSGTRLTPEQNKKYSGEFGRDMSDVRIHNDPESNAISQALNARAFTIGADVFLSKGIDPGRSQRDQKTLTHELTHVVQQNGQAGSGPLRLGAAHTTQEHEAEATAEGRGGVSTSASDTVQRGFWTDFGSNIGSGVGHMLLKQFGLEEAFNDFMTGSDKVEAAEKKMEKDKDPDGSENWKKYQQLKTDYETATKDVKAAKENYEKQVEDYEKAKKDKIADNKRARAANPRGALAAVSDIDPVRVNEAKKAYDDKFEAHEKLKKDRLELLKKYDGSITQEDVDKKDSGKFKMGLSVVMSSLAGGLSTFMAKDDPAAAGDATKIAAARTKKQKEARAKVNTWFASTNKGHLEKKNLEEKQTVAVSGVTNKKQVNPEEEYKDVLWAAYQDIKDEAALKGSNIDRQTLWEKVKGDGNWDNIKSEINDELALNLDKEIGADFKEAKAGLQKEQKKMADVAGFENAAALKVKFDAAQAAKQEADIPFNALENKEKATGGEGVSVDIADGNPAHPAQILNLTTAQNAVDSARTDPERELAQRYKDKLNELIAGWNATIAGKNENDIRTLERETTTAFNAAKAAYENGGKEIYDAADDEHKASAARAAAHRAVMDNRRANVHSWLGNPENLHKKLSKEQIDKLKGVVRGIIMKNANTLKEEAANKNTAKEARRTANYGMNVPPIVKGIRFNTKEEAKELPFYKKNDGGALDDAALDAYMESSIKDSAEMKSFWDEVKARTSTIDNTPFTAKETEHFITEGTKAFRKLLEDMRKNGDKKYERETDHGKVLQTIQERTFALLPKDLQTLFGNTGNQSFQNLFAEGGVVVDEKTRITNQVAAHVPLNVDSEAAALAKKIQAAEDRQHKGAPAENAAENVKKAHEGLKNREIDGIIKSAYAMVQKDADLKKVYKNPLLFRNTLKSDELKKLIEEGLDQSMSEKEIVEAVIAILKEKQSAKTAAAASK